MSQQQHLHDMPNGQTPSSSSSTRRDGEFTVPATPPPASSANTQTSSNIASSALNDNDSVMQDSNDVAGLAPDNNASLPQTIPNSQESNVASGSSKNSQGISSGGGNVNGQLQKLSALATAQDKTDAETVNASRKRTADGVVKKMNGRTSPVKGHSRSVSAISMASTTGSHIGEMSADLKTRLAYAMVKVNNGWQTRSLQEVESLASHAASPTSSSSTIYRRQGSSASPNLPATPPAQVHFAVDPITEHRQSNSPQAASSKPMLAPPAPIQPATSIPHSKPNSRRNHNPRQPPTLLTSHSATASSHQHRRSLHTDSGETHSSSQPTRPTDAMLYSPHQNVREQDAIETLLFMSSPGNSTNVKHAFSPSASPGPQHEGIGRFGGRHALPNGPRRILPGGRPAYPSKRVGFDKSPAMPPPHSPMELDSPQQMHQSPGKWTPKRRANGVSGHTRGALSLPSGIGMGGGRTRQTLRDEDIERLLDRAAADSSDDEEIQLPARVNAVTRPLGV